jgi:bifunctional UDP-N-acetylglucosamine pyrophosphorylase/glucosamine-1-phosphate N-acetyltransferase
MSLSIVILAAGQGKRMRSALPKVMHRLAGRTLLEHVYHAASQVKARQILVVYGHGGERLREELRHLPVEWIHQRQQHGTGHAVQQAMPLIPARDQVLVLYGDIPLITTSTLQKLVTAARKTGLCLVTENMDNPSGYGRIIRNRKGALVRIVEEKDATERERAIHEVNTGIMGASAAALQHWVSTLDNKNAQKEFYLTDIVAMAVKEGIRIATINPDSPVEVQGINDRRQLAEMERYYQLVQAHQLMHRGVSIMDPARFDLRGELETGGDAFIDINVLLEGRIKIGANVRIGANCCIRDTVIGDDVSILPNCVIENAIISRGCRIGPFARIRPDTVLDEDVHVGNFVEIKKSVLGKNSRANHLSYIGDSELGSNVNVGAGTITCNFDGAHKHKTIIEDDVFIGSDTQLIAPVTIGAGATIAAGTTVTKDVEGGTLAISRAEQKTVRKWKRPKKTGSVKRET